MNKTQKLCATAMLVAISVVANAFSVQLSGSNYLSFVYIPCFAAAIYLGIIPAAAVGFLGDLIAGLLFPKGAYNIIIGLASTLIAVIPAVVYKFFPQHRRINLCVSLLLTTIICTCGLNTYALWLLYGANNGKTFWIYLWGRLPFQLLNTVVNGILLGILQESKVIDKIFEKEKDKEPEEKKPKSTPKRVKKSWIQKLKVHVPSSVAWLLIGTLAVASIVATLVLIFK